MAEPFLAEIRMMSFNFAPRGWALCNGQLLPINQNQGLFSLLGTTFGGNGQTTFGLPNLQGRTPIHVGNGHTLGEAAGTASVTLTAQQLPQHAHIPATATTTGGTTATPTNNLLASYLNGYAPVAALTTLAPGAISSVGGSQAHENRQPYLTINFCIALQGIFPSRN